MDEKGIEKTEISVFIISSSTTRALNVYTNLFQKFID